MPVILYPSYFKLHVRWLRSLTRITYLSKLIGMRERHPVSHRRPAVGWSNSFPTNLSFSCRVIRPYGLTPSGSAQALFKTLAFCPETRII
ncbi:hypothetical protein D5071_01110 [Pectobacterium carotovorum]|uniref:Uncharacterized protein n=1 Tax=Pectobacterium carotovorum TaxID=554 RepID=A0A419B198_PECCA|nr:hypothetical protein D5071_01110 [Pectobacterium carotovorum]